MEFWFCIKEFSFIQGVLPSVILLICFVDWLKMFWISSIASYCFKCVSLSLLRMRRSYFSSLLASLSFSPIFMISSMLSPLGGVPRRRLSPVTTLLPSIPQLFVLCCRRLQLLLPLFGLTFRAGLSWNFRMTRCCRCLGNSCKCMSLLLMSSVTCRFAGPIWSRFRPKSQCFLCPDFWKFYAKIWSRKFLFQSVSVSSSCPKCSY